MNYMKSIIPLILGSLILCSCKKNQEIKVDDVISNLKLSSQTGLADGGTTIIVSVDLSKDADISKRSVIFTISSGNFSNGQNGTITIPADLNNVSITATTTFISPSNPGTIVIRAMPNIPDSNKYVLTDSINFTNSQPSRISIQTSSYGLRYGFQSEDTIIGTIRNSAGQGASSGMKVLFEDSLLTGTAAGGKYRKANIIASDATSKVSTIYSNGVQPQGTDILIRGTVLDEAGNKTNITNYIIIKTIN